MTLFDNTIPVLIHSLNNLQKILLKAEAYADQKQFTAEVLVNSRLFPDMLPLVKQIQIAADTAKGCAGRLSATDIPSFADNESSLIALRERLEKTITYLKTFKPEQINGSESKAIELKLPNNTLHFTGIDYVNYFVLPNLYFHVSMAYAILRHNGVELGKRDFLGETK